MGKRRSTWQGGSKVTRPAHVARVKALVAEIKNQPCMDCGQSFPPVCMDFDHRNPEEKVESVSTMVGTARSLESVLKEIEKCDIVCANCHRIRTFTRLGQ